MLQLAKPTFPDPGHAIDGAEQGKVIELPVLDGLHRLPEDRVLCLTGRRFDEWLTLAGFSFCCVLFRSALRSRLWHGH